MGSKRTSPATTLRSSCSRSFTRAIIVATWMPHPYIVCSTQLTHKDDPCREQLHYWVQEPASERAGSCTGASRFRDGAALLLRGVADVGDLLCRHSAVLLDVADPHALTRLELGEGCGRVLVRGERVLLRLPLRRSLDDDGLRLRVYGDDRSHQLPHASGLGQGGGRLGHRPGLGLGEAGPDHREQNRRDDG